MYQEILRYNEYSVKEKNGKIVVIFDSHNMALPIWGIVSNNISQKCKLISFDSHADTTTPFHKLIRRDVTRSEKRDFDLILPANTDKVNYIPDEKRTDNMVNVPSINILLRNKKYMRDNFSFDDVVDISKQIENDEQIKLAYNWDYISDFHIITRERSDEKGILACAISDGEIALNNRYGEDSNGHFYDSSDINSFMEKELVSSSPLLVDFDLDFFINRTIFNDNLKNAIQELARKAQIITIAKEPDFFNKCRNDETFENEEALCNLMELIL